MENIKIYSLEDSKTGEIRYIGYTKKSLDERLKNHIRNVKEAFETKTRKINKRLSWLKSIDCKVSITLLDEGNMNDVVWMENFYIELFKNWGFKLTNGTSGGDGGNTWDKLTEEGRKLASERLSNSLKGKSKIKTPEHEAKILSKLKVYNQQIKNGIIKHPSLGRKATLEERSANSKAKIGVEPPNKGKSKYGAINQYDLKNNFITTFENPALAAASFYPNTPIGSYSKVDDLRGNIVRAATGKQKSCNKYIWRFS